MLGSTLVTKSQNLVSVLGMNLTSTGISDVPCFNSVLDVQFGRIVCLSVQDGSMRERERVFSILVFNESTAECCILAGGITAIDGMSTKLGC